MLDRQNEFTAHCFRLVKRRRALVETNPPRNSQLQLIEADERWGQVTQPVPSVFPLQHRIERLPMPQKTHKESCRAAASKVCAASCASNSAGGT
jgi:hypothetical protein